MEEQNNFGMGGGGMIDMLRNEEQTYVNNVEFEREWIGVEIERREPLEVKEREILERWRVWRRKAMEGLKES